MEAMAPRRSSVTLMATGMLAACVVAGTYGLSFLVTPSSTSASSLRGRGMQQGNEPLLGALPCEPSGFASVACGAASFAVLAVVASTQRSQRASIVSRKAVAVGQSVTWSGKSGKVAYVGPVDFAAGEWIGVALDGPGGMHDGSVLGKAYFSCTPGQGVFCQESMLFASGAPPPPTPTSFASPSAPVSPDDCTVIDAAMCVGAKVLWNGKAGTIKFVGPVSFTSGQFVGVELEAGGGMHDGSVLGKRYFDARPGCGIFSAPNQLKVTAPA